MFPEGGEADRAWHRVGGSAHADHHTASVPGVCAFARWRTRWQAAARAATEPLSGGLRRSINPEV
jgi:hypothetical protein